MGKGDQGLLKEILEKLEGVLLDRITWAKSDTSAIRLKAIQHLRGIRKLISSDGPRQEVVKSLYKANYIPMLMTNAPVLLRFAECTDEALRTVIAISRTTDRGMTARIVPALFEHGALIFSILALKEHRTASNSINIQGMEMMTTMLNYVSDAQRAKQEEEDDNAERPASRGHNSTTKSASFNDSSIQFGSKKDPAAKLVQDAVHQLLLHGAAALLVRMLATSISSASETATRRAIFCTRFLLENTPLQMTLKFATYDNFSAVRSLCMVFVDKTRATQLEGAALLTGLLSSSVEVAELITSLGAWDQLSTILAANAEEVQLPRSWLVGSLSNIRRLGEDPVLKERMQRKAAVAQVTRGIGESINGGGLAAFGDSSLLGTSTVEGSGASLDMEGSFKNLLQSMLEAAMDSGPAGGGSGGMVYSNSASSFARTQAQSLEFSGAMQMTTAESTPNLSSAHGGPRQRTKSSGASSRPRPGSRGTGSRPYSSGNRAKPHKIRPTSASAMQNAKNFLASRDGQQGEGGGGGEETSHASSYHQGQGLNSMFVKRLKQSPLGMPVNPDKIRELRKQNGGKLPDYLPHALGGSELGHRPGPDYGSKVKKPQAQASVPSAISPPSSPKRGSGGAETKKGGGGGFFGGKKRPELKVAPTITILPIPEKAEENGGDDTGDGKAEDTQGDMNPRKLDLSANKGKDDGREGEGEGEDSANTPASLRRRVRKTGSEVTKKQQHARFIAQKLFVSDEDRKRARNAGRDEDKEGEPGAVPAEAEEHKIKGKGSAPKGSAVSKLSFAEKLHVMILQVTDL